MTNPHVKNAGLGNAYNKRYFTISKPITHDSYSVIDQFRQAMQAAGINYSGEIIADGTLRRFHVEGHRSCTKNGAYILHTDGHPAGYFQDYKSGISKTWRSGSTSKISYNLSRQIEAAKRQREAEIHQKHKQAAEKGSYLWSRSTPATKQTDHAYLVAKHIQPHGARLYRESLVIPIYNESDQLINLQFISPEGEKRFLTGGRKKGCFHIICDVSEKILICEGFATGASLYEDSGECVVIAFDAGNLLPVAKNIRELSPDSEIIICGDNDQPEKQYPQGKGQTKAREAALSIGGKILIPPTPGQDWNDVLGGQYA